MDERLVEAAQALLTGYDTALNREWRAEDRTWRNEDLKWRDAERAMMRADLDFIEEQRLWRLQDMEQRHVDNARVLWARVVERNRRDVEEKSEQLKALANMAALVAGFSLTGFLQFQWDSNFVDTTGALLPLFGLTMALTVGFDLICVIICTLMLVSIIKTGQRYMSDEEEAEFMARAHEFAVSYRPGMRPPAPSRSFAAHWDTRCESSWRRAFTLFGLSIPACFANLSVAAWIKFDTTAPTAGVVTGIMVLSMAAVFWQHRKWTAHILTKERLALNTERVALASNGLPFDWHLKPVPLRGARGSAAVYGGSGSNSGGGGGGSAYGGSAVDREPNGGGGGGGPPAGPDDSFTGGLSRDVPDARPWSLRAFSHPPSLPQHPLSLQVDGGGTDQAPSATARWAGGVASVAAAAASRGGSFARPRASSSASDPAHPL